MSLSTVGWGCLVLVAGLSTRLLAAFLAPTRKTSLLVCLTFKYLELTNYEIKTKVVKLGSSYSLFGSNNRN